MKIPPHGVLRDLIESEVLEGNLGQFLDRAANRYGERIAFDFFSEPKGLEDRALTYGALNKRVTKLASGFYKLGIRKGDHIGVMLPKVPAFMLTWLALARLGAVMVPINVRYTARELAYTVKDSDAAWLIVGGEYAPLLAELGDARPAVERTIIYAPEVPGPTADWAAVMKSGDDSFVPPEEPALDDLCTIQYTSGTTGFPKGVMLAHRHWLVYARVGTVDIQYLDIERMLLLHPFYYVGGQSIALFGVRLGWTIFVAPHMSLTRFMPWMRETQSQYAFVSHAICKAQVASGEKYDDIKFLHISSAFTKEAHAEIEQSFGAPLRNAYGMTENSLATYMPLSDSDKVGPDCIGIPVPFREVLIADSEGQPVPEGEVGEICVRGPGILLGYYNKPDANKASFFGEWHRSGDRGYRDREGYYHFLGRMKDVIRRSGENISAVEVESVLVSMEGIERVAAIAVPDDMRGEEVKVYVKLASGLTKEQLPPAAIIAHCAQNLAPFKVPRYIEYRIEIPTLNTADKVEKHVLLKEKPDLRADSYDHETKTWR